MITLNLTPEELIVVVVAVGTQRSRGHFSMEPLRIAESSVCEKLQPLVRDAATAAAKKNGEFTSLVEGLKRG